MYRAIQKYSTKVVQCSMGEKKYTFQIGLPSSSKATERQNKYFRQESEPQRHSTRMRFLGEEGMLERGARLKLESMRVLSVSTGSTATTPNTVRHRLALLQVPFSQHVFKLKKVHLISKLTKIIVIIIFSIIKQPYFILRPTVHPSMDQGTGLKAEPVKTSPPSLPWSI